MEKFSYSWFIEQANLMSDLLDEKIDVPGVIELLQEMAYKMKSECCSWCRIIVCHLLELKYSTNKNNKNHWESEITDALYHLRDIFINSNGKTINTDLLNNFGSEIIDYGWKQGIKMYQSRAKIYSDLQNGLIYLDQENPFSLQEFLELDVFELKEKLK